MHGVMSYHKTMTHQYTVNVQRSYTYTNGIVLHNTSSLVLKVFVKNIKIFPQKMLKMSQI